MSSRASGFPRRWSAGLRVIDLSGAWRLDRSGESRRVCDLRTREPSRPQTRRRRLCMACRNCIAARLPARGWWRIRVLRDFGDSGAEAAGGGGVGGSGARHCGRREERSERRGKGADGEDALYVCGGQSFGVRRVYASPHGRAAGADRRDGGARLFLRRTCCRFRAEFCRRFMCASRRRRRARAWRRCTRSFLRAARWCGFYRKALPQIQYSVRTNYADIGFQLDASGQRAVIVSCLDNLLKGAAGQAVQNMNVMLGWPESEV